MPSMPVWHLSAAQTDFEERVRTVSLAITALGVVGVGLYYLRPALIPLVLALALKHLLQPVIHALSVRPLVCCGRTIIPARPLGCGARPRRSKRLQSCVEYASRLQLPHNAAVVVALLIAFAVLALLAAIVADAAHVFSEHADVYAHQLKLLLARILGFIEYFSCSWTQRGCPGNATGNATNATDPAADAAGSELEKLLSQIPLSELVLQAVESLLELMSNLFIVRAPTGPRDGHDGGRPPHPTPPPAAPRRARRCSCSPCTCC